MKTSYLTNYKIIKIVVDHAGLPNLWTLKVVVDRAGLYNMWTPIKKKVIQEVLGL